MSKEKFKVRTNKQGVAIKGYDPVAYFTLGEPTKGLENISYDWSGAQWQFANEEHRDLFIENPDKYAPQFGGACAVAAATAHGIFGGSPKQWRIENGHLYLNKDPFAAALHKPLSKRIHRISAEDRAARGISDDASSLAAVAD